MVIVGIHGNGFVFLRGHNIETDMVYSHDSSVTLIVDGRVIGALSEERMTRQKYDGSWPMVSLNALLNQHNLRLTDIDCFAYTGNNYNSRLVDKQTVISACHRISPGCRVEFYDHHLCHGMASFLSSPFDDAAVFTFDNSGDIHLRNQYHNNGSYALASKDPWNLLKLFNCRNHTILTAYQAVNPTRFGWTFGLGFFYSVISHMCLEKLKIRVWNSNETPGKIMGLGAYGDADRVGLPNPFMVSQVSAYDFPDISWNEDHVPNLDFDRWIQKIDDHDVADIAAWTQKCFEDTMVEFFQRMPRAMRSDRLCLGGGCALNILLNSRLIQEGLFQDVHVNTAPGDSGLSFGAALLASQELEGRVEVPTNIGTLGLTYTDTDIQSAWHRYQDAISCRRLADDDLYREVAQRLDQNQVVAWFQGASEFGPRALGNRSILSNPCHDNRELLNTKVKRREYWRPYAAVILEDHVDQWLDCPKRQSHYMLFSGRVLPQRAAQIPTVVHRDGSCRVQTVTPQQNPRLHRLLQHFHERTKVPLLVNTSFNTLPNEPIVESPRDAFVSFMASKIDVLVMNNFVFEKIHDEAPVRDRVYG